jgi:hypothetical protein
MRWAVAISGIFLGLAVTGAGAGEPQATDRACASLIRSRNAHSYPPDRQWVWALPGGCVFTRDRPRPAGCSNDRDLGCIATPDVHVRIQRREYVFHLTMKGSPAKAIGLARAGTQLLVAHDGRGSKARQTLIVDFRGIEFDGIVPANEAHGLIPDLGPLLQWRFRYTLDKRKGLCCPRVDPAQPEVSPFDVNPTRSAGSRP